MKTKINEILSNLFKGEIEPATTLVNTINPIELMNDIRNHYTYYNVMVDDETNALHDIYKFDLLSITCFELISEILFCIQCILDVVTAESLLDDDTDLPEHIATRAYNRVLNAFNDQ